MRALKPWYVYRPTQILRRIFPNERVTLPWGDKMRVDKNDAIGRAIATTGVYELGVSEAIWRLLKPGDVAFDVGANIGYMTLLMKRRGARVIAFEPHPAAFQALCANVSGTELELRNEAVTDHDGEAMLSAPIVGNNGTASLEGAGTIRCDAVTLDSVIASEVALLKVDVEGHEYAVFSGARLSLEAKRIRNIVFEDHCGLESRVCKLLRGHGYEIFPIGWRMNGPALGVTNPHEAPNFIATLQAAEVRSAMQPRGWRVLGH